VSSSRVPTYHESSAKGTHVKEVESSVFDDDKVVVADTTARLDAPATEGYRVLPVLTRMSPLMA
jgi:hypothetical protein